MLKAIQNIMMEQNAHAVKHIKAVGIKDAQGIVKEINLQIDRDFSLAGPLTLSTISKRVHAVRWANTREIFVVETNVQRVVKETIASGIAKTNNCPYCEDVHDTSISSAGDAETSKAITNGSWKSLKSEKIKKLIEWSLNTRNPNSRIIKNPPFSKTEAAEIIGTALVFHSTNRLANIFLDNSPLPKLLTNSIFKKSALNIASKTLFKTMVMKKGKAGDSLQFIHNGTNSGNHKWAEYVPSYAKTLYARDSLLAELEVVLIPKTIAQIFKNKVNEWGGEEMPLGRAWLNDTICNLTEMEKPIATLVFLSAFAPFTITDKDIANFYKIKTSEKDLLEVCYWSVEIVTNRISEWLIEPFNKK